METGVLTRQQVADILGITTSQVAALCAPSKKSLISNEDGTIDMGIQKNNLYITKRKGRIACGKPDKSPKEKKRDYVPEPVKPKEVPKPIVVKEAPVQKFVPRPVVATASPVKEEPEETEEQIEVHSDGMTTAQIYKNMDLAKMRKMNADAEASELKLANLKGDLVSASEVAPLIIDMAKERNEAMLYEMRILINDFAVEYSLPKTVCGKFEKNFVLTQNKVDRKTIDSMIEKFDKIRAV